MKPSFLHFHFLFDYTNPLFIEVDASAQSPRRSQRPEIRHEEIHEDSDNDGSNNEG